MRQETSEESDEAFKWEIMTGRRRMGLRSVVLTLSGNRIGMVAEETECTKEDSQISGSATG